MKISIHRIYDSAAPEGYRVLVDRLWPRGISKEKAHLDEWCKEIAPSVALRTWFAHQEKKWPEFRKKYLHELGGNETAARGLLDRSHRRNITLLYGAKDITHNQAVVLKEFLEALLKEEPPAYASPPCYAHEFKDE